jgi:hypothetical protein
VQIFRASTAQDLPATTLANDHPHIFNDRLIFEMIGRLVARRQSQRQKSAAIQGNLSTKKANFARTMLTLERHSFKMPIFNIR